jgi:hypothetical protein
MRRKQLLQQLEQTLAIMKPVLKEEEWQLTANLRPLPLASIIKRSLRRIERLSEQRQLRLQVHNSGNKSVYGDLLKLECILFELLVTSCVRARPGSRINLWCSPLSPESIATPDSNSSQPLLELFIAESGFLDECLLPQISSSPQSLNSINLNICQQILRSWGGDLQFFQMEGNSITAPEEHHYSIRLLLPLAM